MRPLLALLLIFSVYSCSKEELRNSDLGAISPDAQTTSYGHCPTCELPAGIAGGLPGVLMANDDIMNTINNCYAQTPATVCQSGTGTLQSQTTSTSGTIYLAGSLWGGNVYSHHCSFMSQLAGAASATNPGSGWLLKEVTNIVHLGSGYFRVYATWQKYICGEYGDPQGPKLP